MRVLGVDPGLTRCGLGVVEGGVGRPLQMVAVGVIRTPVGESVPQRLLALQDQLEMLVTAVTSRCGPEIAAHRVRQFIVMLTAELAARAGDRPGGGPGHRTYVADLVDWFVRGLARPAP